MILRILFLQLVFCFSTFGCKSDYRETSQANTDLVSFYSLNKKSINGIFSELENYKIVQHVISSDSSLTIYLKKENERKVYYFLDYNTYVGKIQEIEGVSANPRNLLLGDMIIGSSIFEEFIKIRLKEQQYFLIKHFDRENLLLNLKNSLGEIDQDAIIYLNDSIVAIKQGKHGGIINR